MTKPWSFPTKESICLQFESNSNLSIPLKVAEEISSTLLNDKKFNCVFGRGRFSFPDASFVF